MKVRAIISAFVVLLVAGCSEDKTTTTPVISTPVVGNCESNLSTGLIFSGTFAYTGAPYYINGTKFCNEDLVSVLVNDKEVSFEEILTSEISFIVPSISGDSASLKIKTKTSTIDLKKKIRLFPGDGVWTEVQSFPGLGRSQNIMISIGTKGYLGGGKRYTGFTAPNNYNFDFYNDLYEFNHLSNTWTLFDNSDFFKQANDVTAIDNKLFLFNNIAVNTYDLATKSFGTASSYLPSFSGIFIHSLRAFSIGTNSYGWHFQTVNNADPKLVVTKYNAANLKWEALKEVAYDNAGNSVIFNFAFEYKGLAYSGTNAISTNQLIFRSYDPVSNEIKQISSISIPSADFPLLRYLFTINDLSYFCEFGSSSLDASKTTVINPGNTLYIFNHKIMSWKIVPHVYPESFYQVTAFGLSNRGFAGLGVSSAGAMFAYSQKFYEFIPK